ncbi:Ketopantoate reductase ApbA/PanE [Penicillium sp. IBT 18751x]|nr:Ketopantoate reductase ApbA/PanE [Penicillium sp. IBT 18751x]
MSDKAQVLLVGCGGVGVIAALNLERSRSATVTAVLRSNYAKVISHGFHIQSCDHGEIHGWRPTKVVNQIPALSETEFDYAVITTKNTPDQPPTAAELIESAVVPGKTAIVLIQNGLNIQKPFLNKYPNNICLSGVSFIGSHETAPAVIEHEEPDRLIVGAFRNPNFTAEVEDAKAQEFIKLYSDGGKTDCSFTSDVPFHRWQKLVYNACLNPICAITGLDTGRIRLADDTVDMLLRPAMKELVAAASATGVILPSGIENWAINVDPLTMYFRPSMQEDVEKGNLIEFETLVGEPLREGLSRGVPMPTLTFLYHTLKAMQWRLKEQRGLIAIPEKGDYLKNGSR